LEDDPAAVRTNPTVGAERPMTSSNRWCTTLGIAVPRLESVAEHREANTYSLMLVGLLECGASMRPDGAPLRAPNGTAA
jgi:hypothetical protein